MTEETVSIPDRIYHAPALINATNLTVRQRERLNCLMTRRNCTERFYGPTPALCPDRICPDKTKSHQLLELLSQLRANDGLVPQPGQ